MAWNDKGKCIARACVGSSYCHQGSDRNIGAYLSGILSTKLSVLQSALRAYTNAISQFNSCSLNINQNSVFSAANAVTPAAPVPAARTPASSTMSNFFLICLFSPCPSL